MQFFLLFVRQTINQTFYRTKETGNTLDLSSLWETDPAFVLCCCRCSGLPLTKRSGAKAVLCYAHCRWDQTELHIFPLQCERWKNKFGALLWIARALTQKKLYFYDIPWMLGGGTSLRQVYKSSLCTVFRHLLYRKRTLHCKHLIWDWSLKVEIQLTYDIH